jgi:peroxiredoxin
MPRSFLFVLTLLTISLGLNVDLAWKIKKITSPLPPNKVGVKVSHFAATDINGHPTDVSFNMGKPTLIYFIDPECKWCKANTSSFSTLAQALDGKMRVIILSSRREKLNEFLNNNRPAADVLVVNSSRLKDDLGLIATPQTFVVDTNGRVEHHWAGAYSGETRTQIEKALNLQLPETKAPS